MEHILYEAYRRNPDLRQQVERQARVERGREFDRLVAAPIVRWVQRAIARMRHAPRTASRSTSFQA
jgi:hypothetical protein